MSIGGAARAAPFRREGVPLTSFTADAAAALPGPEWLRARRAAAAERFADLTLPTEAEEIWRYSRISQLDLDRFAPVAAAVGEDDGAGGVPPQLQPVIDAAGPLAALVVVCNGRITEVRAESALRERGLFVGPVGGVDDGDDALGAVALSSTDAFTEMNTAFLPGAVLVRVPAGMAVERPVLILHWTDAEGSAVFPRTIVQAGPDSEVTVVEHQGSPDGTTAFVDPVVELDVAAAARLRYLNVQALGPRVWQVGYQASRVARDATLQSAVIALGGDYARVRTDSTITGKGATSNLTAVYFADGDSMHDFRTLQDHAGPASTSDLLFKGAVQDRAQAVYSGLIRVRKDAPGTNAFQTNRNLVLSEGAGAMSVPNLEIENNDVRCSHATAVGPIDEEQLYYLESRGVPPDAAERLIVLGFFGEILDKLPLPEIVASVKETVAAKVTRAAAAAGAGAGAGAG